MMNAASDTRETAADGRSPARVRAEREEHARDPRPLGGYAVLAGTFTAGLAAVLALTPRARLRHRPSAGDVLLVGLATGTLARLVTRDAVLAPFRAPFTELEEPAGAGEVNERARGAGLRHAIGELLTCPFCLGPWAATALMTSLVHRPLATRFVASVLVAVTISNGVNQAYTALRKSA